MAPDATPGVGGDSTPTVVIAVPSTPPPAAAPTAPPLSAATPTMPQPMAEAPLQLPPSAQDAPDATVVVSVPPAPGTITSIESKPSWLKGQSQEFRDGVTRQVGDFRTGLDRVGRGLQWLGSKLRRPK